MKKILLLLAVLLGILLLSAFLVIPGKESINEYVAVKASPQSAYRFLVQAPNWSSWWPGTVRKSADGKSAYRYRESDYEIGQKMFDGMQVHIAHKHTHASGLLRVMPLGTDSSILIWRGEWNSGGGLWDRLRHYGKGKEVKSGVTDLLGHLARHLEDASHLYGINIHAEVVKDTILLYLRSYVSEYPDTEVIYRQIDRLKSYARSQGAAETNHPMLNVVRLDSSRYQLMVAIPVDRELPAKGDITIKRMVPGNILVTEVRGGVHATQNALMQLENYLQDHSIKSPAIPFESLVTDRSLEKDSSKWLTRIYYPVI